MKFSKYNLVFPAKGNCKYYLFNTLTHSIYYLDKELALAIMNNQLGAITPNIIKEFKENGIIIKDSANEAKILGYFYQKQKKQFDKTQFMISLTYGCNLGCDYCFEKDLEPLPMTRIDFSKVLNFVKKRILFHKNKKVEIHLFGGEPFLYPELAKEFIEKVNRFCNKHNKKFSFLVYTNGTCINKKALDWLKKASKKHILKYAQVTLDGPKLLHDARRHHKNNTGTFDKIIDTLIIFRKNNIKAVARINIDAKNWKSIPKLMNHLILKKLGSMPIGFGIIREMTEGCKNNKNVIKQKDLPRILKFLYKQAISKKLKLEIDPRFGYLYCSAFAESTYVVDPQGKLYKCAGLQGRKENQFGAGIFPSGSGGYSGRA